MWWEEVQEERARLRGIVDLLLADGTSKEEKKHTSLRQLVCRRYDPKNDERYTPKPPSLASAPRDQSDGDWSEARSQPTVSRETYYHVPSDISTLFSGQPFSFLSPASETEKSGEQDSICATGKDEVPNSCAEDAAEAAGQERSLFFFHWGNPQLANRLEDTFVQSSVCEEVGKKGEAWPQYRTALKQLLRHRHRCAVKEGRRKKRMQQSVV